MRIIRFSASNVKKLGVVEIFPKGNVIKISGKNGAGKTCVLDAIMWALCGTSTTPKQVVRRGEKKAIVQLDIEELVVTRTWREGGDKDGELLVQNKHDRSTLNSPQKVLDALMGKITFDPLEFIRMTAAKQLEALKGLVKLTIDLYQWQEDYNRDYIARKDAKKERIRLETERDAIQVLDGLPAERRNEAAMTKELAGANEFNDAISAEERKWQAQDETAEQKQRQQEQCLALAERLRKEAEAEEEKAKVLAAELAILSKAAKERKPLAERKNVRDLADALNAARLINAEIGKRELREDKEKEVAVAQKRWEEYDASLAAMEKKKAAALAEAHFPVEGLGFGDGEVLYNGLPFAQASNAEQIRVSAAIGMADNPKLRVMRVKDGGLLDEESQAALEALCIDEDFQLWEEVVDTTGKVGVYLVDGEIKAVNEPTPIQAAPAKAVRKPRVKKQVNQ
jgi:hypothetical protein